ncbi:MAG: response regulator [Oscillibacter sp.]|nr:response regulator [Oscillibacter sp.]
MLEQIKKKQRLWLIALIIVCMAVIVIGGTRYVTLLQNNLREQSIQNVLAVTKQQRQAFDTFIEGDRERLHSFAEFFVDNGHTNPEEIQVLLTLFTDEDAIYSVICLDEGWFCSSVSSDIRQLDRESLEIYNSLEGSGVRNSFAGQFTGAPRFGYYETFTFASGHRGLIQKSYDRSKVSEVFSLSFYNDQGMSHVVNQDGEILMRPASVTENLYDSIFDALADASGQQEEVDRFVQALQNTEEGTVFFSGESGDLAYTYVPLKEVDGWFLVSVVSASAFREEADKILQSSQSALFFLALTLVICAVFLLLIWRTQKDIASRDQEIAYQTQLFNIFSTYLSRNTSDLYMMLDHKTEALEYISPNAEQVLGVTQEELIDYFRASDLAADPEATEVYYAKINALKPGETSEPRDTERVNPRTGEHRFFQENAYCVNIQGRPKRVSYLSDRTKERKSQAALADALQMARAAGEAKTAFLSSVSHDIRTPMNAIIGFTALMRDEAENPAMVLEYTRRIDAASQHLLGLINDVLDMNKIESGSAVLNLAEMNLAGIIEEVNTIIRPQTRAKNQTFDIFVTPLKHEHLKGDKVRINQILINLLSNSVKYTPEGGAIRMRVEEMEQVASDYSRIRFVVSDNGIGMSEAYQKVIFEPFTREEDSVAVREAQGTGLGMPITKSLVNLMGGTIAVDSKLGEGTTFTVELELYIQEQEDDPEFWSHHGVTKMIVADDDADICRNIVSAMSRTGVTVEYATDGETAIRMMQEAREAGRPYDLILLDWKMPNLGGMETARLIRKSYSDKIPILLLTAYDWSEIEQEAMEIGVNHFLPKPFFITTFKEAIRRVMGSQKEAEAGDDSVVKGKRILVVDDIEVNRIILVKILTTLGAQCEVAGNGQEALEAFERSEPGEYDLILMDVQMPVMDGYAATRAIRDSGRPAAGTVPIIAMTANAFVEDVREAINSGMDAHVAKPIQMDKLKAAIQQVLDKRTIQEQKEGGTI